MLLKRSTICTFNNMMLVHNILATCVFIMHSIVLWYTQVDPDMVQVVIHGVI